MAQAFAEKEAERRTKVQQTLGIRVLKPIEVKPSEERTVPFISDSTIRLEMSIFGAVMNYAIKKRYVPASQRFDERPKLKSMRRDEFTLEEYRKLHTVGRKWIAEADKPSGIWYRTFTYKSALQQRHRSLQTVFHPASSARSQVPSAARVSQHWKGSGLLPQVIPVQIRSEPSRRPKCLNPRRLHSMNSISMLQIVRAHREPIAVGTVAGRLLRGGGRAFE